MNGIRITGGCAVNLLLVLLLSPSLTMAMSCPKSDATSNATAYTHQFDSGAQWDFCWHIDDKTGLTISNIYYGPPAEASTKIMESASLAQILLKYDEDTHAEPVVSGIGLGGQSHVLPNRDNCPTGDSLIDNNGAGVCTNTRDLNILTSVRRSAALRRHEVSIHAFANAGAQTYEQVWRFSEDGEITPAVRVSGELSRFTNNQRYGTAVTDTGPLAANATLLFTWRLDFNIGDTQNDDIVEQIEFVPHVSNVVRRSITTTALDVESFHKVHRTQFRGWLVRDKKLSAGTSGTTRMGYYLDPQSSGYNYVSRKKNWALFNLAITRGQPCERLASGNSEDVLGCDDSLDQFVNSESLIDQNPVVWFSLARQFLPKSEDYPAITTREASFKLIPFDWSASTPFTALSP